MSRKVKAAAIQMRCSNNVGDNIKKADEMTREAVKKGANIILLPELFERQYFCQERRYEYYAYAKSVQENDAVQHFTQTAKELGVVIIVSFYEKNINVLYNTVTVIDADGKLVESWTSEAGKTHMIERLPVGKYTLREESAPYGYKVASDVTFEVKETAEIQKVSMKDEQAVGKIVIEKTDKITGKPIEGVVFEVRNKDGKVLDTLTTDKNGHAESKELPICTYNEDGSFKEDIHYTVVETKAADGYILDETAHDVTLRYDDNAPDVVVTTLKLINVPTEPKLPQTGDNANPLLYLGIGALALITGVGVGLRGRKKKNKQ